jgi:hypothetical protein
MPEITDIIDRVNAEIKQQNPDSAPDPAPETKPKQKRQLVAGEVTYPKPNPADLLKQYRENITDHLYNRIFNAACKSITKDMLAALEQFDQLKREKYPGIDWTKADKWDQRILTDIYRIALAESKRELFREYVRQTELPLTIQRPFLTQGPGAAHVYIIDWIYNRVPPAMMASVTYTYPQPKRGRHLGRYLYASIERSDKFYLDLSNHIYLKTGQRKGRRQIQRYLEVYCKCEIFKAIDLGRGGALLAVGFLRKHKTTSGGIIYRKYPLATVRRCEKKWLKYGHSLASRNKKF